VAASGLLRNLTGSVAETALATVRIPQKTMGAAGRLRVNTLWSFTNSSNAKTIRIRFGGMSGTVFHSENPLTSQRAIRIITDIENRDAANAQVGKPVDVYGYGPSTNVPVTSAIDTNNNDVDLCFTGQLANSGETISLEAYHVELLMPPSQAEVGLYYAGDGILIASDFKISVDRATVPPLTSPAFLGTPTAPSPLPADNGSRLATTQFVQGLIAGLSTVYLTHDPVAARAQLGLGGLALLDLITWAQTDATLRAAMVDYRSGADAKFITPKVAFDSQAYVPLTDAATIAIDLNSGFNFSVTITTNRILGFPTNLKVGQNGFIDITQPSSGSKLLDFAGGYTFDSGVKPQLDSLANVTTSLFYHVRSLAEVRIGAAFKGVRATP
jgi:hypothetical protein